MEASSVHARSQHHTEVWPSSCFGIIPIGWIPDTLWIGCRPHS